MQHQQVRQVNSLCRWHGQKITINIFIYGVPRHYLVTHPGSVFSNRCIPSTFTPSALSAVSVCLYCLKAKRMFLHTCLSETEHNIPDTSFMPLFALWTLSFYMPDVSHSPWRSRKKWLNLPSLFSPFFFPASTRSLLFGIRKLNHLLPNVNNSAIATVTHQEKFTSRNPLSGTGSRPENVFKNQFLRWGGYIKKEKYTQKALYWHHSKIQFFILKLESRLLSFINGQIEK